MKFPRSYQKLFRPWFNKRSEAAQAAADNNGCKPFRERNGWATEFTGSVSNVITTGRQMHVIDENGHLHKQILTLVWSYPFDGTYMIDGFAGEFVNNSNWHCDIYVSVKLAGSEPVANKIKELTAKGRAEYNRVMNLCRPSLHLIKEAAMSEWDKAKELGYL